MKKTEGQKSRDTVPLRNTTENLKSRYEESKEIVFSLQVEVRERIFCA
jgi:hypothetical protein